MSPSDSPAGLSRRRLLRGAAGLGVAGAALPAPAAAEPRAVSVMTRNLYVGVDLSRLFGVSDRQELRTVAGQLLAEVERHPYAARADAIAAEISATSPDVVCVQEAALVRTRSPSQFDGDHDPGASDVRADVLELLTDGLDAEGASYDLAAEVVTNDVEVPADTDDGSVDLRLTNRLAVLVREDSEVTGTVDGRFAAGVPVPLEGVDITIRRGFAAVDVIVGGGPVTVATTHLEALSAGIRNAQAEELIERLPADRPTVVAGDLNSGPDHSPETYESFLETFEDAHAAADSGSAGHTCCHDADLRNESPSLSRRVDAVLFRDAEATAVARVGAAPDDRVPAEVGDETVRVWPSDHAGVVASLAVEASDEPTPTASPAPTGTPTRAEPTPTATPAGPTDGTSEPQDGMGVVAAVLAGGVALLSRLRSDGGE